MTLLICRDERHRRNREQDSDLSVDGPNLIDELGEVVRHLSCGEVDEAEAFVAAGIRDVLVTNEIVGTAKLARLAELAKKALARCGLNFCCQSMSGTTWTRG